MIKVRRLTRKNLNANPLQYFTEFWERDPIDEDNNWNINTSDEGSVIREIFNGRASVLLDAPAGDTATLGSLMSWNVAPTFFSSQAEKEIYIEQKLVLLISILGRTIGGAGSTIHMGFNEVNNGALGNDAVYGHQDNAGTAVGTVDGGVAVEVAFAEAFSKLQIEIQDGLINFYIGTVLVSQYVANLPDDMMYIWFRVADNADLRIGPLQAYYERIDIERN